MAKNDDDIIKRRATAQDWDKVTALYIKGETLESIVKAFPRVQLSAKNILKKMALTGATAKKKALNDRVMDNLLQITEQEKLKVNQDCIKLFNTGARVIEGLLNKYVDEVENGVIDKHAKATAYNTDMLMAGVTKIQKGLRVAYGMDENGKLYEKEPEVLTIDGINTDKI